MKVYISGPISGRPNGNLEAFLERAQQLRELGHEPVNPHEISPEHISEWACLTRTGEALEGSGHPYGCHLRADILELMTCEGITFLRGWEYSRGAGVEEMVARGLGLIEVKVKL